MSALQQELDAVLERRLAPLEAKIAQLQQQLAACAPAATERIDVAELARILKKTIPGTRQLLCRRRDLPRLHLGRRVLFERAAIEAWIAANEGVVK